METYYSNKVTKLSEFRVAVFANGSNLLGDVCCIGSLLYVYLCMIVMGFSSFLALGSLGSRMFRC
jgi:hypothetical protein